MSTKLIELEDGTLVEIEVTEEYAKQISSGFSDKVNSTFNKIQPILVNVTKPIVTAWQEINQDMNIEKAEVELGLSFEGEGNLYVTKSKASANLVIKLILRPKNSQ